MSSTITEDKSTASKTPEINRKELEALTNVLFLRKNTDKVSSYQKAQKKPVKARDVANFCESHMVGSIEERTGPVKVAWRIMGMRMKRPDGVTTDYDVYRLPFVQEIEGHRIHERMPMDRKEGIFRLCRYDSEADLKVFNHEYCMFKMLARWYPSSTDRVHYPAILGQGTLSELRYLNINSNSYKHSDITEKPAVPRPYFILESFEPSLETLFKSNRMKSLSVNVSVFVTIGCIKALRLLHMKGFAHRNVQPAYFSIRLPCGGLLNRKESELCDLVAITELWCCRKYRANIPRTRTSLSYLGNWKYGSTETLIGKEPTAVDDVISCIYIMTEFVLGQIPWAKENGKEAIVKSKKTVERMVCVEDEKGNTLLNNYSKIFEWLKQQPHMQTLNYESLYEEILRMIPETAGQAGEQSLFGFSNPLLDAYDHGFVEKKAKDRKNKGKEGESSPKRHSAGSSSSKQANPEKKHRKTSQERST
ncbi:hypothetical protein V3C99_009010, partial [Haemonchus contortus]